MKINCNNECDVFWIEDSDGRMVMLPWLSELNQKCSTYSTFHSIEMAEKALARVKGEIEI